MVLNVIRFFRQNHLTRFIMALFAMLIFGSCSMMGTSDEPDPSEQNLPLTLNSLSVVFKDESAPTFNFDKVNSNYSVQTSDDKKGLVLSYEAPENVLVTVSPAELQKYQAGGTGMKPDSMLTIDLSDLPVPRKDPDFEVSPSAGVNDYMIVLTLSLKEGAPDSISQGNTIYNLKPNTYLIYVKSPTVDVSDDEVRQKVEDKINEAESKMQNLGMVVGNPEDNDPSVGKAIGNIVQLLDELNTLKAGTEATRTYETHTEPEAGVSYTTEKDDNGQTVYIVTEVYPEYDYLAILAKAKQLNLALETSDIAQVIVPKIQLSYQAAVQNVEIGSNGEYKIELAGGSGGHVWTGSNKTTTGGKGAKVTATFAFSAGQKLGFRTGGEGDGTAVVDENNKYVRRYSQGSGNTWSFIGGETAPVDYHGETMETQKAFRAEKPGGWPNGGSGGWTCNYEWAPGSGGGGSSDVRIYSSETLSDTFTYNDADPRIMVAGGGGGAAQLCGGYWTAVVGGNGGDTKGGDGVAGYESALNNSYFPKMGMAQEDGKPTYKGINGKPGTNASSSGKGGAPSFPEKSGLSDGNAHGIGGGNDGEGRGGGGGGFIGGEAINVYKYKDASPNAVTGSGAGGSNHVKSNAKSSSQAVNTQFGPGYAVIEWIS